MSSKRDIYIAIMHASRNGVGLRLTADEVFDLSMDDAIETTALNRLSKEEYAVAYENGGGRFDWEHVKPNAKREAHMGFARSGEK